MTLIRKNLKTVPQKKKNLLQKLTTAADIIQEHKHVNIDTRPIQNQKLHTEVRRKIECLAAKQKHGKMPKVQGQHED